MMLGYISFILLKSIEEMFFLGVNMMKGINKVKVLIVIGLLASMFIFVNECFVWHHGEAKEIKQIKSKPSDDRHDNVNDDLLVVVNFENQIPEDWQVDLVTLNYGQKVDVRIYNDLKMMLEEARKAGLKPLVCSSYRSKEKQTKLYQDKVNDYLKQGDSRISAENKAAFWVARPGTSEHQLGLAVDIVSLQNQRLDRSQENSPLQYWLMDNSWKYGFILRYPTNKSAITKVGYEPLHYRYVGKEHAKKIYEQNICLEEYVEAVKGMKK